MSTTDHWQRRDAAGAGDINYFIIDHTEKNQIPCLEEQEVKDMCQPEDAHRMLQLNLSALQQSWACST